MVLARHTVRRVFSKWKANGTVGNLNEVNLDRIKTNRSDQNIDAYV